MHVCLQIGQGDEHELVKAVESNAFTFNGIWIHANFLAKPIGATSAGDLAPKYFFAELRCDHEGLSCISCVKMDPGVVNIHPSLHFSYLHACIFLNPKLSPLYSV